MLPVEPYVGLARGAAEDRARAEGRYLRPLSSLDGPRRLDLAPARVNVVLDEQDRVLDADEG
jgi:hypothetical protein